MQIKSDCLQKQSLFGKNIFTIKYNTDGQRRHPIYDFVKLGTKKYVFSKASP